MFMQTHSPWHTCYWLIRRDLAKFSRNFSSVIIDISIPVLITCLIWGYVMPTVGLARTYGGFFLLGWIIMKTNFGVYCIPIPHDFCPCR